MEVLVAPPEPSARTGRFRQGAASKKAFKFDSGNKGPRQSALALDEQEEMRLLMAMGWAPSEESEGETGNANRSTGSGGSGSAATAASATDPTCSSPTANGGGTETTQENAARRRKQKKKKGKGASGALVAELQADAEEDDPGAGDLDGISKGGTTAGPGINLPEDEPVPPPPTGSIRTRGCCPACGQASCCDGPMTSAATSAALAAPKGLSNRGTIPARASFDDVLREAPPEPLTRPVRHIARSAPKAEPKSTPPPPGWPADTQWEVEEDTEKKAVKEASATAVGAVGAEPKTDPKAVPRVDCAGSPSQLPPRAPAPNRVDAAVTVTEEDIHSSMKALHAEADAVPRRGTRPPRSATTVPNNAEPGILESNSGPGQGGGEDGDLYVVNKDFEEENLKYYDGAAVEMSVKVGEMVKVEQFDVEWWYCCKMDRGGRSTGERGWVPECFLSVPAEYASANRLKLRDKIKKRAQLRRGTR